MSEDFELVSNRCKIASNYLKGWFIIDVVSIIPFDLVFNDKNDNSKYHKLARIIRVGKL